MSYSTGSPSRRGKTNSRNGGRPGASTNNSNQYQYGSSRGMAAQHDDTGNMIDDSVVVEFIAIIKKLPAEHWRERTEALVDLVSQIPDEDQDEHGITRWYKSPPTLRRLSYPLSTLLLDQRSSVVKQVTQHIALLVRKTDVLDQNDNEDDEKSNKKRKTADYCKYLMKDLLPTILSLHGQTVNIIRGSTTNMMTEIIPLCRFKSGLPILLDRLRKDKSREVREACVRYLKIIIQSWHHTVDNGRGNAYLTRDVCLHIGNAVGRALMDPSQLVRLEAKMTFEIFREIYPKLWNEIVQKKQDGIFSNDLRLQKTLINAAVRADAEKSLGNENASNATPYEFDDGSSVGSTSIQSRFSAGSRLSIYSRQSRGSVYSGYNRPSGTSSVQGRTGPNGRKIDTSRHMTSPQRQRPTTPSNIPSPHMSRAEIEAIRRRDRGRESPAPTFTRSDSATRIQAAFRGFFTRSLILDSKEEEITEQTKALKINSPKPTSTRPPLSSPPGRYTTSSRLGRTAAQMARRRQSDESKNRIYPPVLPSPVGSISSQNTYDFSSPSPRMMNYHDQSHPSHRVLNVTTLSSPGGEMSSLDADAVIARAKSRKSSIMLQRRLKRNSTANNPGKLENSSNDKSRIGFDSFSDTEMIDAANEKVLIAHQLLTAHKSYIDELMEGLKMEMDCIRDFEFLLEPSENGQNTIGLTEDQILSYFESMVQFLDKSTDNSNKLRHRIDKICRAEPTNLNNALSPESQGAISNITPPTEI